MKVSFGEPAEGKKRKTTVLVIAFLLASLVPFVVSGSIAARFLSSSADHNIVTYLVRYWKQNFSITDTISEANSVLSNYLDASFNSNQSATPHLAIDIKFNEFEQLRAKREEALRRGFLKTTEDDFVPARIRIGGKNVKAKVRLKGDFTNHVEGKAWSLRVHVSSDSNILGMRKFSLQKPPRRNFHYSTIMYDFLRKRGVLAGQYLFVDVSVNGAKWGVMNLEEHAASELLESQGRREGIIFKQADQYLIDSAVRGEALDPEYLNWRRIPIEIFRSKRVRRNAQLSRQAKQMVGLYRAAADDRFALSEVFDSTLWAKFLAACDLFAANHSLTIGNLRFYYNPVTNKIEPLAFDAHVSASPGGGVGYVCANKGPGSIVHALLQDSKVRPLYFAYLAEFSRALQAQMKSGALIENELVYLRALRREYPWIQQFDRAGFSKRLTQFSELASKQGEIFSGQNLGKKQRHPTPLYAYLIDGPAGTKVLEIVPAVSETVKVVGLKYADPRAERITPLETQLPFELPIVVQGQDDDGRISLRRLPIGTGDKEIPIELQALLEGDPKPYTVRARNWWPTLSENMLKEAAAEDLASEFGFVTWDAQAGALSIEKGTWDVPHTLVTPEAIPVTVSAGTTLRFAADAALIIRGPLKMLGTKDAPIILKPMPTGKGKGAWPGLMVETTAKSADLSYVDFRDTSGVRVGDWMVTGAVTFRGVTLRMANSRFLGTTAEDALNTIHANYTLKNVVFERTASDAFDADFSNGLVEGSAFHTVAGDGFDVGGGQATIKDTKFDRIGDKAISVGENGRVEVLDIDVRETGACVVSKDLSRVSVTGGTCAGVTDSALMAYQKKPLYGPAELIVDGMKMTDVGRIATVQNGSRLVVDGTEMKTETLDVDALYKASAAR